MTVHLCGGLFADRTMDIADGLSFVVVQETINGRTREATYVPCNPPKTAADNVQLWRISPVHATYETHAPGA